MKKEASLNELQAMQEAIAYETLPDIHWIYGDDLCDCTFQRIGDWTNPYLGQTLRVRLCCIWAELRKMFPQFVQVIPASFDSNRNQWVVGTLPWDSEEIDMPLPIWYRQIAEQTGRSLASVREEYSKRTEERPKKLRPGTGKSRPPPTEDEILKARREQLLAAGYNV